MLMTSQKSNQELLPIDVKLISYSQPADDISQEGIVDMQELIAFCARVSNPANQMNTETSDKLIKYLIRESHWSPLEMVSACLEINTTRDIAHQIVRHRSFAFQEFSQRYANPDALSGMFVRREARLQDDKNRQNSTELEDTPENKILMQEWLTHQDRVVLAAHKAYTWAIEKGIAKEQARVVLPEGLTKSRLYMNGSIRSWIHYIELRRENGTQKEHMDIAKACATVIAKVFPLAGSL